MTFMKNLCTLTEITRLFLVVWPQEFSCSTGVCIWKKLVRLISKNQSDKIVQTVNKAV